MDLARLKAAAPDDELYESAKCQFERANAIQAGTAAYNLACIYSLRNDQDACFGSTGKPPEIPVACPTSAKSLMILIWAMLKNRNGL